MPTMSDMPKIDSGRLLTRLDELGEIGALPTGGVTRLAFDECDTQARLLVARWLQDAGLTITYDKLGSIFGTMHGASNEVVAMTGSHIDTVKSAGILDGCLGVVAGLEALQTISESSASPTRSLVIAVFSNEEGARFAPDMLGSRYFAGTLEIEEALSSVDGRGITLREAMRQSGIGGTEGSTLD